MRERASRREPWGQARQESLCLKRCEKLAEAFWQGRGRELSCTSVGLQDRLGLGEAGNGKSSWEINWRTGMRVTEDGVGETGRRRDRGAAPGRERRDRPSPKETVYDLVKERRHLSKISRKCSLWVN